MPNSDSNPPASGSTRRYNSTLRQEQAQATQDRILQALCDLLVEERPSNISIPAVAKRAGVSLRSVYHHFPNKDALYEALPSYVMRQARGEEITDEELATDLTPQATADMVRRYMPGLAAQIPLFRALAFAGIDDGREAVERRRTRIGLFDEAMRASYPRLTDADRHRLVTLVSVIGSYQAADALHLNGEFDMDEVAELMAWATFTLLDRARRTGSILDEAVGPVERTSPEASERPGTSPKRSSRSAPQHRSKAKKSPTQEGIQ